MPTIYDLDSDLIEEFLIYCDPLEVSRFAQTARVFRALVYEPTDDRLWRSLYLAQPLDDPRTCVSQNATRRTSIDWRGELQRIVRARTTLSDPDLYSHLSKSARVEILRTVLDMICYVSPASSQWSSFELSENLVWVAAILRHSELFNTGSYYHLDGRRDEIEDGNGVIPKQYARPPDFMVELDEELQLRARLHTHFGLSRRDARKSQRAASRAYVYSMRRYRFSNRFGPFMPDGSGRVNWIHMQALHHVMSMHLVDFGDTEEDSKLEFTIFPMSLPFSQIVIPKGIDLDTEEDWAGIEGVWNCSFCFCDHRDLLSYNQLGASPEVELDTSIFENLGEVYRALTVNLTVTSTTPDPDYPTRPRINFGGHMGGDYTITGWVQMASSSGKKQQDTPTATSSTKEEDRWGEYRWGEEDVVQWHFVSGEQGHAIWSSEGVQVGGIRSSFGVLGAWTTVFHDEDDPVGPFWMRKAPMRPEFDEPLQETLIISV